MSEGQFICPEEFKTRGVPGRPRRTGRKAHIGEVQASIWDGETLHACQEAGVILL